MKTVRRFTHFRMKSVRNPEWNEYSKRIFLLHMDGSLLSRAFVRKRSGTWVGIVTGEGGNEHIHITLLQIFLRSQLLQHCRTHGLRQIKFVLVVVLVMNTITKYFFPTWTTACVLKCQPSPHCTERGCKVFRRKNDSTIGDVRPSSSKTTLHFQTQKRLYNCRCPSVIITFFKIFSRKNDSTFVNVRS